MKFKLDPVKHDAGKPRLDLVPLECLEPIARVREFALSKYGADGVEAWREISDDRLFAALLRHCVSYQNKERDSESGLPGNLPRIMQCGIFGGKGDGAADG